MPKLKTRKSAKKRYKVTAGGKIMRRKGGISHLLEHKSSKAKRDNAGMVELCKGDAKRVAALLPYDI